MGGSGSYWCGNNSAGGWAEVDAGMASKGERLLPLGLTYAASAPELANFSRWADAVLPSPASLPLDAAAPLRYFFAGWPGSLRPGDLLPPFFLPPFFFLAALRGTNQGSARCTPGRGRLASHSTRGRSWLGLGLGLEP